MPTNKQRAREEFLAKLYADEKMDDWACKERISKIQAYDKERDQVHKERMEKM